MNTLDLPNLYTNNCIYIFAMDHTTQRITGLEARIAKYELELDAASTDEEKQRISSLIKSRTETLNNLLINERKTLPQGTEIYLWSI